MKAEVFGTNDILLICDELDSDGELEIEMVDIDLRETISRTWINKDMAERIILKLGKAFDIV